MKTKLYINPNKNELNELAAILRDGGLVAIPTETVYGLAANAFDEKAVLKIYEAKNRAADNPLIVHVSDTAMLSDIVAKIPNKAKALMDAFWAGPLTVVLPKSEKNPYAVTKGMNTVAVRMPSHPVALSIIDRCGFPLAAPSANISGTVSPTSVQHVFSDFDGKIDAIVDGGQCEVGIESTVISFVGNEPLLLRPGFVTAEQIENVIGKIKIAASVLNPLSESESPLSPGMKYKHYSPKAKVILIDSKHVDFINFVNSKNDFALCFNEDAKTITGNFVCIGSFKNEKEQAANLFSALRKCDEKGAEIIYARLPDKSGIGLALLNRLLRAAAFEVICIRA